MTKGSRVRAVFPAASWPATVHVLLGLLLGVVTFSVTLTFVVLAAGLAIVAVAPVPLLWSVRAFTAMQRSRFRALLGVRIPVAPRTSATGGFVRRTLAEARSGTTWRQIGYHLLALPIGVLGFIVVTVSWSCGLAGAAILGYRGWLPERGIFDLPMRSPLVLTVITVAGLLLLVAAPRVAIALARLEAAAARALLGPSWAQELAMQMVVAGAQPGRCRRRGRRRAPPHRAGPARRHPAAAGLARAKPGHGPQRAGGDARTGPARDRQGARRGAKLDLLPVDNDHRRVLAVLRFLRA